jgi:hypothetical protein
VNDIPQLVDRALRVLASQDSFHDDRPSLTRLFGPTYFSWTVGWLTVDRVTHPFAHVCAPPPRLAEAERFLASRFHVTGVQKGLLDRRRHHPFAIITVSGTKDGAP